jgi:SAM-dependent methyltransferase
MSPENYEYQYGYSDQFAEYQYDPDRQSQKAGKTLAVMADYYGGLERLKELSLLDIGCSTGLMTAAYAEVFGSVVGFDIDVPAVKYAHANNAFSNSFFCIGDAIFPCFTPGSFDVITCTHIYEHVPDSDKLMAEIYELLKPGGICYFAAQNRYALMEPHYRLPLLSAAPRPVAHVYMRLAGKGKFYYEKLRSLSGLKELTSRFEIVDYTRRIIEDPVAFEAVEMIRPGSATQKAALVILDLFYGLCPTYIWLLKKNP